MAKPLIQVDGARTLRRKLNQLDRDLTSARMKQIHGEVGDLIAAEGRKRAPRRSGRLAGDIRSQATTRTAAGVVGRASVPYANPIHWGWPSRPNMDRGWRGGPIRANRFMYAAVRQGPVLDRALLVYQDGIGDLIDQAGLNRPT